MNCITDGFFRGMAISAVIASAVVSGFTLSRHASPLLVTAGVRAWKELRGMRVVRIDPHTISVSGNPKSGRRLTVAALNKISLSPRTTYRLRGLLRVDQLADEHSAPYFRIELRNRSGRAIGEYYTIPYDMTSPRNEWQEMATEFVPKDDASAARIDLVASGRLESDASVCIKDVTIQETVESKTALRLHKNEFLGHPRLYLSPEDVEHIRLRLTEYPCSRLWASVKEVADDSVSAKPPKDITGFHEAEVRKLGRRLPFIGIAYLLTEEARYLNGARTLMNQLCTYPHWASDVNLGAAHVLFGMSVVYDWLYSKFSAKELATYREKMEHQAASLYRTLVEGRKYWAAAYMNNRNYANTLALGIAGYVLLDETDDAGLWLSTAEKNFSRVLNVLPPDGAWHEGLGYWRYATESLLQYFLGVERVYGLDGVKNSSYFKNTARFRLYAALPGFREMANYADSPSTDWRGPGGALRALASLFSDEHAQWLAERVERAHITAGTKKKTLISWMDLIWHDESVAAKAPEDLPTAAFFDQLGILVSRTDWSDEAVWMLFKAGPPQGGLALERGVYPGGHIHPDEGTFLLWAYGQWLIVDDGYVRIKRTSNHSTLTINGSGQVGEGREAFDRDALRKYDATVTVVHADLHQEYKYVQVELGRMYPPEAGVKRYRRSFVVLPSGWAIVRDEVELKRKGNVESRIHLGAGTPKMENGRVLLVGSQASLLVEPLMDDGTKCSLQPRTIAKEERTKYTNEGGSVIALSKQGAAQWKCTVLLVPSKGGSPAVHGSVRLAADGECIVLLDEHKRISVNFTSHEVAVHTR